MKRILNLSLVLAVVLTTMGAHAGEIDFALYVKNESGQGKTVTFAFNQVKKVALSLYDSDEVLIHTENVTAKQSINRTYDLNQLPEGTYFLEAETEKKVARYEITVTGTKATLSKKAISEVYKPVVTNKDGMVSVNIQNTDKSPVTVKIYDAQDNEVYNENLSGSNVSKTFDMTNSSESKYTFVMTYDNKTFIETVASR